MSNIFNSAKRTNFFKKSGLPFWDAFYQIGEKRIDYPYGLYTCHPESLVKIKELQKASVLVAEVFDEVTDHIKRWTPNDLQKWGFDLRYGDLLNLEWDKFFALRIGWAWNEGSPKIMEINSQTPSFWFEPEAGDKLLVKEFGLKDPNPQSKSYLKEALNQAIISNFQKTRTKNIQEPRVGFVTCNWHEDLHIMNWLSSFCDFEHEVLNIENLDFSRQDNIPFSRITHKPFDALILWYPLEWLIDMKFLNGDSVWEVFIEALTQKSFTAVHLIPAFFIQSKAVLAYITQNKKQIFTGELKSAEKYFPRTVLEEENMHGDYIAKPLWGREGRGSYIVKKGEIIRSRYQESYYTKQTKVYQDFLKLQTIKVGDKKLSCIYEAWIYRVGKKLIPGAIGCRGSEHLITDDFSYWLPLGVK